MHTLEYYLVTEKNDILSHKKTRRKLKCLLKIEKKKKKVRLKRLQGVLFQLYSIVYVIHFA